MAHITRRPLAIADILDIWDHIAEDSVEQADRPTLFNGFLGGVADALVDT